MIVEILPHPGHGNPENSAVQTSEGDKFSGEKVDLPADEAKLLIGAKRAIEVKPASKARAEKA